ncbi:hypothetical protein Droror1_Dr00008522 [Drosera rotundifolia]
MKPFLLQGDVKGHNVEVQHVETVADDAERNGSYSLINRKKRGPTRCLKLIALPVGEKLKVEFDDSNQPIGENATDFIWYLGSIARNRFLCPQQQIQVFKDIRSHMVDRIWDSVMKLHGKEPSRLDVLIKARKRKTKDGVAKEIGLANSEAIEIFEELKKKRIEGQHNMNDDEIFEAFLGPEKHGYLRAHGPGESITEYFGMKPSRANYAMKLEEAQRKERDEMDEVIRAMEEKLAESKRIMEERLIENDKML